jgi:hypothetical protein
MVDGLPAWNTSIGQSACSMPAVDGLSYGCVHGWQGRLV